jgi:transglutaminase-like putative cysteine protease
VLKLGRHNGGIVFSKGIILLVVVATFWCGFLVGSHRAPAKTSFHDMVVNWPHQLTRLVTPKDKRIRSLAAELKTSENAYSYVRDHIADDPSIPALPAGEILVEKRASCLGKAVLLCSLYGAMGVPSTDFRVVTGQLEGPPDRILDHAWVEIEHDGVCLQQDTTKILGSFGFDQFRGTAYTNAFIHSESYTFNDRNFAVISRLNQMKGSGHPSLPQ